MSTLAEAAAMLASCDRAQLDAINDWYGANLGTELRVEERSDSFEIVARGRNREWVNLAAVWPASHAISEPAREALAHGDVTQFLTLRDEQVAKHSRRELSRRTDWRQFVVKS